MTSSTPEAPAPGTQERILFMYRDGWECMTCKVMFTDNHPYCNCPGYEAPLARQSPTVALTNDREEETR